MTTTITIATDLFNLLSESAPSLREQNCDTLCDTIASAPELITIPTCRAIMTAARAIDPTFSDHAAHIRDTIRDNTDRDIDAY